MTEESKKAIIEILQSLNASPEEMALAILRQAMQIRRERFIRVCAYCHSWWDGEAWTKRPIPQGRHTHGMCDECYKHHRAGDNYDFETKSWLENG